MTTLPQPLLAGEGQPSEISEINVCFRSRVRTSCPIYKEMLDVTVQRFIMWLRDNVEGFKKELITEEDTELFLHQGDGGIIKVNKTWLMKDCLELFSKNLYAELEHKDQVLEKPGGQNVNMRN